MRILCGWCGAELGTRESDVHPAEAITHGVCPECAHHLFAQMGMPLQEYLDGLMAPVAVVGGDGCVLTANARAQAMLEKELTDIIGRAGGDVFECAYAQMPEGCGHTVHCSGCAIRRTVMATHESGRSRIHAPATLYAGTQADITPVDLLISTEKVGDVVLLRIDAVDGQATSGV